MSKKTPQELQGQLTDSQELILRARRLRWAAPLMGGVNLGLAAAASLIWTRYQAWQGLALAGAYVLWAMAALGAWYLVGRQQVRLAARLILYPFLISGILVNALTAGAEMLVVIAVLLVGWSLCFLVFARRRIFFWVGVLLLAAALAYLVTLVPGLPRVAMSLPGQELAVALAPAFLVALVLIIIWQAFFVSYRRGIRLRLLVGFVMLVLLPAVLITIAAITLGTRQGERQALNQLLSVATLKEAEINFWITDLQLDLKALLAQEDTLTRLRVMQATQPGTTLYTESYNRLQVRFNSMVEQTQRFEEIFLLNTSGKVLLSTNTLREGRVYSDRAFFTRGLLLSYVEPPFLDELTGKKSVFASAPILNERGNVVGVLVGRANLNQLTGIMGERAGLGETGETYLVGADGMPVTRLLFGEMTQPVLTPQVQRVAQNWFPETGLYIGYAGRPVLGVYRWVAPLGVVLVAEQSVGEAYQGLRNTFTVNVWVALFSVVLSIIAGLFITQDFTEPLARLALVAQRVAEGDLDQRVGVERQDEIGRVASAFDSMTAQLRILIANLEARVQERTRLLEQRSAQLSAAAQVAREATAEQDLRQLLERTVRLISERFNFYHAGIFLLDEKREYAVLQAASSEGGQRMLARGHRLAVGQVGIVGSVAASGEARIALDVGADAVFFNNPDLPLTRSEMAVPLKVRGQVIGVLDVQSTEVAAFTEADIELMQVLADQLAVAIENANLLAQAQQRLREIEVLLQRQTAEGWRRLAQAGSLVYTFDGALVTPRPLTSDIAASRRTLSVPIVVQGQELGQIDLVLSDRTPRADERELAQVLASQIAQALDSARLFRETQETLAELDVLSRASAAMVEAATPEQILDVLVRYAVREPFERCVLALVEEASEAGLERGRILAVWEKGLPAAIAQNAVLNLETLPVLRRMYEAPLWIGDVEHDPELDEVSRRTFLQAMGFRSVVGLPLKVAGKTLGGVMLESRQPVRSFTEREKQRFTTLADRMALALNNLQLLAEAQARAEWEHTVAEISDRVRASADMGRILQTLVRDLGSALDATGLVVLGEDMANDWEEQGGV